MLQPDWLRYTRYLFVDRYRVAATNATRRSFSGGKQYLFHNIVMRGNIHMIQGYRHCVKKATAHAFSEIRDCAGLLKVVLAKRFIVCERFSKFKPSGSVSTLLNIPKLWRAIAYGVSKKYHVDLCRFRLRGHITLQRVDKGHVVKTR